MQPLSSSAPAAGAGEAVLAFGVAAACVSSWLFALWGGAAANFAGFAAGAVAAPVLFGAAWSCGPPGVAWGKARAVAACAAALGWAMGAAHCYFWAEALTR